jgi:hypothetical protein
MVGVPVGVFGRRGLDQRPVGWLYSNTGGGWEYPLFWLMAQAALVLAGSGAFALQTRPIVPEFKQANG